MSVEVMMSVIEAARVVYPSTRCLPTHRLSMCTASAWRPVALPSRMA